MTTTEMYDFGDGKGPVPAHRHPNGGGWVADTAFVMDDAEVEGESRVFGALRVEKPIFFSSTMIWNRVKISHETDLVVLAIEIARLTTWGIFDIVNREKGMVVSLIPEDAQNISERVSDYVELREWGEAQLSQRGKHPIKTIIPLDEIDRVVEWMRQRRA